jgi:hypothetical protein
MSTWNVDADRVAAWLARGRRKFRQKVLTTKKRRVPVDFMTQRNTPPPRHSTPPTPPRVAAMATAQLAVALTTALVLTTVLITVLQGAGFGHV